MTNHQTGISQCQHLNVGESFLESGSYCVRCRLRIHIVMKGAFQVIRFEPCREGVKSERSYSKSARDCNCKNIISLGEDERLE